MINIAYGTIIIRFGSCVPVHNNRQKNKQYNTAYEQTPAQRNNGYSLSVSMHSNTTNYLLKRNRLSTQI